MLGLKSDFNGTVFDGPNNRNYPLNTTTSAISKDRPFYAFVGHLYANRDVVVLSIEGIIKSLSQSQSELLLTEAKLKGKTIYSNPTMTKGGGKFFESATQGEEEQLTIITYLD